MMKRVEAAMARRRTWLVLPAMLVSLGCGGAKGDVSGKVTYLGKPLPEGTVTFFGAENRVVGSSAISTEGNYLMPKVPAGPVKIAVTVSGPPDNLDQGKGGGGSEVKRSPRPSPPKGVKSTAPKWKAPPLSPPPVAIPAKYRMPEQSGLTYTVQPGPQEYTIDLK